MLRPSERSVLRLFSKEVVRLVRILLTVATWRTAWVRELWQSSCLSGRMFRVGASCYWYLKTVRAKSDREKCQCALHLIMVDVLCSIGRTEAMVWVRRYAKSSFHCLARLDICGFFCRKSTATSPVSCQRKSCWKHKLKGDDSANWSLTFYLNKSHFVAPLKMRGFMSPESEIVKDALLRMVQNTNYCNNLLFTSSATKLRWTGPYFWKGILGEIFLSSADC